MEGETWFRLLLLLQLITWFIPDLRSSSLSESMLSWEAFCETSRWRGLLLLPAHTTCCYPCLMLWLRNFLWWGTLEWSVGIRGNGYRRAVFEYDNKIGGVVPPSRCIWARNLKDRRRRGGFFNPFQSTTLFTLHLGVSRTNSERVSELSELRGDTQEAVDSIVVSKWAELRVRQVIVSIFRLIWCPFALAFPIQVRLYSSIDQ